MNATTATVKSVAAPLTSALVRFVIVSVSTRRAVFGPLLDPVCSVGTLGDAVR